jgi:hypothetical protein
MIRRASTGIAFIAAFAIASPAARADFCGSSGHPTVYVTGTTAPKPFIAALARALFTAPEPITVVYKATSACVGVSSVLSGTTISGDAIYWDPSKPSPNEVTCTLGTSTVAPSNMVVADIGVSDVFASTCYPLPNGLPSDIGDFFGPIEIFTFVVPKASTQKAISAAAAYFVFGFGADSGVEPWTDISVLYRRGATTGTTNMIATAIGVKPSLFKGEDAMTSDGMISKISSVPASKAEAAIGILADTDISETVSLSLTVLAYKHYNQECAYLPDSAPSARDKQNVRDGHYAIWGPLHFLAKLDSSGYVKDPDARRLIDFITGAATPPGGVDLIRIEGANNLVPTCAMRVKRTTELGALSASKPSNPCGCYFESVTTGHTTCRACATGSDCPSSASICSLGFCEGE